jgi:hypothetical protein
MADQTRFPPIEGFAVAVITYHRDVLSPDHVDSSPRAGSWLIVQQISSVIRSHARRTEGSAVTLSRSFAIFRRERGGRGAWLVRALTKSRPSGSPRLCSISLAGIVDISLLAIGCSNCSETRRIETAISIVRG